MLPNSRAKPKPEWSTDFTDYSKYKLSQTEMIQRKAALQSKHKEEARSLMQERMKKLEMGIIDDDTRKVYETALTSKNIELNPPIRRNLSQMIQQQREEKSDRREEVDDCKQELKETQQFIRKIEKAKKEGTMERTMSQFAERSVQKRKENSREPKKYNHTEKSREKSRELSKEKRRQQTKDQSSFKKGKDATSTKNIPNPLFKNQQLQNTTESHHEETLASIEETIRFMEQRLFSHKEQPKKQEPKKEQALNNPQPSLANTEKRMSSPETERLENMLSMSHLSLSEHHEDECLSTIRRIGKLLDDREQNQDENEFLPSSRPLLKPLSSHKASQASIDFSLTNQQDSGIKLPTTDAYDQEYQRIKKSLFEEVNRLQSESSFTLTEMPYKPMPNENKNGFNIIQTEESISMIRPKKSMKKPNAELQRIRNQIAGTKTSVEGLKIEPLNVGRVGFGECIVGFDFRGSINIKKNLAI